MSLLHRFKVCQNSTAENMTVTDITGLYDAATNTGGWGTPNIDVTSPTLVKLTVTTPDGVEQSPIVLKGTGVDPNTTWPSSNLDYFNMIIITPDMIGGTAGDLLGDGTYKIVYDIDGETQIAEHYLHMATTTSMYAMFANLEFSDCSCDTDALDKALYAYGMHEALRNAVSCSQSERITAIQAALNKIFSNTNSSSGCSTC